MKSASLLHRLSFVTPTTNRVQNVFQEDWTSTYAIYGDPMDVTWMSPELLLLGPSLGIRFSLNSSTGAAPACEKHVDLGVFGLFLEGSGSEGRPG